MHPRKHTFTKKKISRKEAISKTGLVLLTASTFNIISPKAYAGGSDSKSPVAPGTGRKSR